jgi:MFS family permease
LFQFVKTNARWLATGFLLLLASSFGQTFFISISGGEIRREFDLTDGQFGLLYMGATLAGALTLVWLGQIVDRWTARRVILTIIPVLALGGISLAVSSSIPLLALSLYLLRLFGQGMMVHTAYTLIGRWFSAGRGRAVSLSALGLNTGMALLPMAAVLCMASLGWRNMWLLAAAILLLIIMPITAMLAKVERVPSEPAASSARPPVKDWTRAAVLRDPCFYMLLLGMLPPAFISNTIFFHQVHLAQLRGWPLEVFASAFMIYAVVTVLNVLLSGQLIDRFSAMRLLTFYLLPFGVGCLVLGFVDAPWAVFAFMVLYGISDGFSLTLYGSLWPEVYGTRFLGAIRSVIVAISVFASAIGPGLGGLLIDSCVPFPAQIASMGLYCIPICGFLIPVTRHIRARQQILGK